MDEKKAINHLKDLKEILDGCGIDFWLEDGTLLGAFRDKGMVPWDKCDIDIGAFRSFFSGNEQRKKITKALSRKGFSIYFFEDTASIHRGNFNIDVIFPEIEGDEAIIKRIRSYGWMSDLIVWTRKLSEVSYYGGFRLKNSAGIRELMKANSFNLMRILPRKLKKAGYRFTTFILRPFARMDYHEIRFSKKHFTKLDSIQYIGINVKIPSLTEKYLELKYGDWKTPPKDPSKWRWWEQGGWAK